MLWPSCEELGAQEMVAGYLLGTWVHEGYPELRIYQDICELDSDSVLTIALTLVTPFTEQETEAKKKGKESFFWARTFTFLNPCDIVGSVNK